MAAARRSPPLVLKGFVDMDELTGEPGPGWTLIKCISRKAYGCGDVGQEIVEGLQLYMHFGDGPALTSMAIRMSDRAPRSIDAELELSAPRNGRCPCREINGGCIVRFADQNLIVFSLVFDRPYRRGLAYHLVYDAIDASLSLFKELPDDYKLACGPKPLLERTSDGRGYKLILMARKTRVPEGDTGIYPPDVLCVCSPETRDIATWPWLIKGRHFPSMVPDLFCVHEAFSFKSKAFWADLSQGIVYCDLHTNSSAVDFGFISLPKECQPYPDARPNDESMKITRTMGCVEDSIWFVCVEYSDSYGDERNGTVRMWTLDLTDKQWREKVKLSAKGLWGLYSFKKARLPESLPVNPVLTADGALTLVLPDESRFKEYDPVEDYICGFDMYLKNLLWHGRVLNYGSSELVILPSNFFPMDTDKKSSKRKWTQHLPAEERQTR